MLTLISIVFTTFIDIADTIVLLGKDKTNPSEFATALDEDIYMKMFDFPDHIIFDMWAALGDAKCGRLKSQENF